MDIRTLPLIEAVEAVETMLRQLLTHPEATSQDKASVVLTRNALGLCDEAVKATRPPSGHPEANFEAFANIYAGAGEAIRARKDGRVLAPLEGDFPRLIDGARGVRFIEKAVESAHSTAKGAAY